MKERKKLGADHHQKDRHSTPSNGQMLHLSIREARMLLADFPEPLQEYTSTKQTPILYAIA